MNIKKEVTISCSQKRGQECISPTVSAYDKRCKLEKPTSTMSISNLSPHKTNWTVKARVTKKYEIRKYSNISKTTGHIFTCNICDNTGEIQIKAFDEMAERFHKIITMDKVYIISNANVNIVKYFSELNNNNEIVLSNGSKCILCEEDTDIPLIYYNLVLIDKIKELTRERSIDVLGVFMNADDVEQRDTSNGKNVAMKNIWIIDKTNENIKVTFWGEQAKNFDSTNQSILLLKGVWLNKYGTLTVTTRTQILNDPNVQDAIDLRYWFDMKGNTEKKTISLSEILPINVVKDMTVDTLVNVMGICIKAEEAILSNTRRDKQVHRRCIWVTDQSDEKIKVTLWDKLAVTFDSSNKPIVFLKDVRWSFTYYCLSVSSSRNIVMNPDSPQAIELRYWFENKIDTCNEDANVQYDFDLISDVKKMDYNTHVNVLGICIDKEEIEPLDTQIAKDTFRKYLYLLDQSNDIIKIVLWGNRAVTFDIEIEAILLLKYVRFTNYGNLSVSNQSELIVNPNSEDAINLRLWYQNRDNKEETTIIESQYDILTQVTDTNTTTSKELIKKQRKTNIL